MDSVSDLISESKEILKTLRANGKKAKNISTQDELRSEISSFVANQMQSIQHQDELRALIEAELTKSILLHELNIDQLQSLYQTISTEKSRNTSALLDLFKPTQSSNALMTAPSRDEDAELVSLSAEERNSIDKLLKVVELMENR